MIELRSPKEIEKIRAAGRIIRNVLTVLCKNAVPEENTGKLDQIAAQLISEANAEAAFKGYRGYPATICTSLNNSIVHEIPSRKRILSEGDIISFDVGVKVNGYYADAAVTTGVGVISREAQRLMDVTKQSLLAGIEKAVEGNRVFDISHAIQTYVETNDFRVVRHFVGHGIGRAIHEDPEIPNFGLPHRGARLKEGMILAIEPMVNAGSSDIKILQDGWTAVTSDGLLSAHFEHTVSVRKDKAEILT